MAAKLSVILFLAFVACVAIHTCKAAPRPTNTELLEKSIADYLRHDKELVKELKQLGFDDNAASERVKRQSEVEIDTNDAEFAGDENKQPGFFDRAAKFVVELLQRFLRWINTDGS